jgi:hypothetical protein
MSELQKRTTSTLLSDLVFQYPLSAATFAACASCNDNMGSRGGWYCRECIKDELIKRGVDKNRLDDLEQRLVRAQTLQQEIRDLCRELGAV